MAVIRVKYFHRKDEVNLFEPGLLGFFLIARIENKIKVILL